MGRLLFKIFLAYWLAAGIVIVISDIEPHRSIHTPELMDALNGALSILGRHMVESYEKGGCTEVGKDSLSAPEYSVYLTDMRGALLCSGKQDPDTQRLALEAMRQNKRITSNYAWFQLIAFPITSAGGARYVFFSHNNYSSALHFYGFLPGYTTIGISCFVTLFLAVLITLPIRRLRRTAGEIAMGKLDARAYGGRAPSPASWIGEDDIGLLVRDFNYMAERLEQLANAQRTLLRDVSHELRSPLTRLGVALGLARTQAQGNMREHLDRIDLETERLNDLIGQILSLSQMEIVDGIDREDLISLSELIVNILPDVQYEATRSGCNIRHQLGADCYIRGNATLLRAAIENILRNTIKYAPNTGDVLVETQSERRSGKLYVVMSVVDNGPGIPEAEIDEVLKPFYRADRARHWQKDGSGIGLAIADRTARLHGGVISVRNKAEGGLIVEMCLPAADIL